MKYNTFIHSTNSYWTLIRLPIILCCLVEIIHILRNNFKNLLLLKLLTATRSHVTTYLRDYKRTNNKFKKLEKNWFLEIHKGFQVWGKKDQELEMCSSNSALPKHYQASKMSSPHEYTWHWDTKSAAMNFLLTKLRKNGSCSLTYGKILIKFSEDSRYLKCLSE